MMTCRFTTAVFLVVNFEVEGKIVAQKKNFSS